MGLVAGELSELEDEEVVSFTKAHPLAGTVFYDEFKDTGERPRAL